MVIPEVINDYAAKVMADESDNPEPVLVQFRDVTAAAYRIKKGVKETPLEVRLLAPI